MTDSCPLSQWCHPTIWSSVIPFSSCPQSFPTSGSFQMSQLLASGGQSIGVSASTSVLPMNTQDWSPLGDALQGTLMMYRTDFWTLWENARVGCFKRTASKHVYYLGWNRSPAQVGCMRQVLRPGALGRPRGIGWKGRWEGGSGWGTHVNPWLIHFNVWQNQLQYCKVISLQLIIIIKKKRVFSNTTVQKHQYFSAQLSL